MIAGKWMMREDDICEIFVAADPKTSKAELKGPKSID